MKSKPLPSDDLSQSHSPHLLTHLDLPCSSADTLRPGPAANPGTNIGTEVQFQGHGDEVSLPPVIRIIVLVYIFLAIYIFQNISDILLKIGSIDIVQGCQFHWLLTGARVGL